MDAKEFSMKIIQVIPFFGMGGAEIMCENLVYELRKLGHEVVVISLYNKKTPITERLEKSGADIRYLDKKEGLDFSVFGKLKKIFKQEKPDVVHTHIYVSKYVFPIASEMKIKVVHTVHSVAKHESSKISRVVNKYFFNHTNTIPVALSNKVQDTLIAEYKLEKSKVPVVLNGIDLSKCNAKTCYEYKDRFKIIHIGSFTDVKNHSGLIESFGIFNRKYPNTELHLIGDGINRIKIEKLVESKSLSKKIIFHGLQSNVHQYLSQMDVFALPSLYEGVPMSIAEAMGTGLPIVATAVGGVPDMLDQSCAQLVPVDVLAIANAFENYYLDYNLRKAHGGKALEMSKRFSAAVMADKYIKIYQREVLR